LKFDLRKIAAFMLVVLLLTGCGNKEKETGESGEFTANSIEVYYVNDLSVSVHADYYQLKQPDILSSSVEEVIGAMSTDLSDNGFEVSTFMLDSEDNLLLTMVEEAEVSKEKLLLVKASICDTLFQLGSLRQIHLVINKTDGSVCSDEEFERTSFFMYED
jgi:hypothetical protein